MSHDTRCDVCGETYYHGDEHDCPGSARDLSERIDLLEIELAELQADHTLLLRALLAFSAASDLPTLRNMIEPLMAIQEHERGRT